MNPYRENKFHIWIIRIILVIIVIAFLIEVFIKKDNPETIRFSENSLAYYSMIFGACSALYAISMLLIYLGGMSEFKPRAGESYKPKIWELCCTGLGTLLLILCFPAAIIFGCLRSMYNQRLIRSIEKEKNEEWEKRFDYSPCPHCGRTRIKKQQEPWEPLD